MTSIYIYIYLCIYIVNLRCLLLCLSLVLCQVVSGLWLRLVLPLCASFLVSYRAGGTLVASGRWCPAPLGPLGQATGHTMSHWSAGTAQCECVVCIVASHLLCHVTHVLSVLGFESYRCHGLLSVVLLVIGLAG